jgi:hypothetical protein
VLNALKGGDVQGFKTLGSLLIPLPGSRRALGLDPAETPQFTSTPGQVAFTPDGSQLVVTTKNNGNDIDVFGVGATGWLSAHPTVIAEAGTNALATFALSAHGTASLLNSVGTGQAATCWVAPAGSYLFASNAGSANVSGFISSAQGALTLLGSTGTDPGTVDAASAAGGQFLYVQTGGNGIVDEFAVGTGGSLTKIGAVTVPGAVGGEGIVAS